MGVRVFDIAIYRDGGSIEFVVERDGHRKHILLEMPLKGEPRRLLVESIKRGPGSRKVQDLLLDLDEWHAALSEKQRRPIDAVMQKAGPYRNPSHEESQAIDLSRVTFVQRYLRNEFLQPRPPAPPITAELREEGKRHPNGWVYVIDPALSDGDHVPPSAIVGAWRVDAEGDIVEDEYLPNPRYGKKD